MKRSGEIKRKTGLKRTPFKKGSALKPKAMGKNKDGYQFNSTFKKKDAVKKISQGCGLKQKAPMKKKRSEPRREMPERTKYERLAPKASAPPTRSEKRHMDRVTKMPCLVCGNPSTLHHVTGWADKIGRKTRTHKCVVPLCAKHHQKVFDPKNSDPISVEGLGHQKFFQKHGKDLCAIGDLLWLESKEKLRIKDDEE